MNTNNTREGFAGDWATMISLFYDFMMGQRGGNPLQRFHFFDGISRLMVSEGFVAKCMVLKKFTVYVAGS